MTVITDYFITRLDDSGNIEVQILDNTPYASHQLYVDNALAKESTETTFNAVARKNKKIDVLGLDVGEQGVNFGNRLADEFGDKVEFILPHTFMGRAVKVYSDHRTGVIDYGRPVAYGVALRSIGNLAWHTLSADEWNQFTPEQWDTFTADGDDTGALALLTITPRLRSGTYQFALVNYVPMDNFRDPYIFTKEVSTRPNELNPYIASFDADLDQLLIGTDDEGIGTYKVYAAPWGSPKTSLDFSSPILSTSVSPVFAAGIRNTHTDSTRYLAVRKTVNGVEEQNFNVLAFTVVGGDWEGNL